MEELNLETTSGIVPINLNFINKYNIKKGTLSPFTCCRIVDKNGEYSFEMPAKEELKEIKEGEQSKNNGLILDTSEILDFAQGADS